MPDVTIDGRTVSVPEGATVIQAAERLGAFIPRYCYHHGLSIAGNCRICLVEVEKNPKLQIACNTPVAEGMVVHTTSARAEEGRRSVLEFLLANHPLDCPVCDQSGECDLQNFYMNFGLYDPRFREQKVKKNKAVAIGPHVMLDQERCILCSRCVRFTDEISKTGEFGIFGRGDAAQIGLYPGEELGNHYSGNVVDICPVGALTDRDFRFKARVWYLSSAPTVCDRCSQGCNIDVHYVLDRPHLNNGSRLLRVKPRFNPDVNQWWMCDEGRYGLGWIDEGRLTKVRHRGADSGWEDAIAAIAAELTQVHRDKTGSQLGVIASSQLTCEELFLIRVIFGDRLRARVAMAQPPSGFSDDFLIKADKSPNTAGAAMIGLCGPDSHEVSSIVEAALLGEIRALWVFGHDLAPSFGEETLSRLSSQLKLFVYSGSNENASAAGSHWVLPSAAYLEKDGTFVNYHHRIQRIGRVFPPLTDAREDWRVLLDIAGRLDFSLTWRTPCEIFGGLADSVPSFAGLNYEKIGFQGIAMTRALSLEHIAVT
jgi:NADH-quinone oxidoreductase subunit G